MGRYKAQRSINAFAKAISYIILVLLFVGLIGALIYLFVRPEGMFVRYGNEIIADNGKDVDVVIGGDVVTFVIENNSGWGAFSVDDCSVTIIPHVDAAHNFEFFVDGENTAFSFSDVKDFSAAFTENGGTVLVTSNGTFDLVFRHKDILSVLETIYGEDKVTVPFLVDICSYPFFAISVTSPDGSENIIIPFRCGISITLDPSEVVF